MRLKYEKICLWTQPNPKDRLPLWLSGPSGLFWACFSLDFSQEFVKMCFSLQWQAHFWKAGHSILHQKTHCLDPQAARKWGTLVTFGRLEIKIFVGKWMEFVYEPKQTRRTAHKTHTCMHHTCHLKLAKQLLMIFYDCLKNFHRCFCDFYDF